MIVSILILLLKLKMRRLSIFIPLITYNQSPITLYSTLQILSHLSHFLKCLLCFLLMLGASEESRIIVRTLLLYSPIIILYFLSLFTPVFTDVGAFQVIHYSSSPISILLLISTHLT